MSDYGTELLKRQLTGRTALRLGRSERWFAWLHEMFQLLQLANHDPLPLSIITTNEPNGFRAGKEPN